MAHDIRAGMQVIGSDGGMVGEVDDVEGGSIKLKRAVPAGGGQHHFIPIDWVAHVDDHVHLSVDAATVRDRWTADAAAGGAYAAAPASTPARRTNWIPWLIGLILLAIVLILGVRACGYGAAEPDYDNGISAVEAGESGAAGAADGALVGTVAPLSQAGAYMAGSEGTPRTFAFEQLNFDTASADIREQDRDEVASLGKLLAGNPNARVRLVGYADARGSDPANQTLGQRRADAVKAALVADGIAADRIETASGGENEPAATNATAQGQFENRRTEVVILSR